MQKGGKLQERNGKTFSSPESPPPEQRFGSHAGTEDLAGILSERIENLNEAIKELDNALTERKVLSKNFIHQINKEIEEVDYQLGHLNPPWKTGFYPELEFLRLSLHKSLTSRKKDIRSEELKYWQDVITLLKEKRKFLDEYKSLLSTRKRLIE
jgi:hypothetical protein